MKVHYSSKTDMWATPQDLFDQLNDEFNFTLDPCAIPSNAKCKKFFTPDQDGLLQSWDNERVFMNPPYGRKIGAWVKKASEIQGSGSIAVCLLPSRTDTRWFHDYIWGKAEIRFIKGRILFQGDHMTDNPRAPFPSMIVVFRP